MKQILLKEDANRLVPYVKAEKKSVPYLYVNLKNFDPSHADIRLYCDGTVDDPKGIYILYYDCLHFYTGDQQNYPVDRVKEMIRELNPRVVMLQDAIGQAIRDEMLENYSLERNQIIDMDAVKPVSPSYRSVLADREDIEQVVDLLLSEEEYAIVYDRDVLLKQMLDRFDTGFSRYYVVKENGQVVSTCSTYGETDDLALVGGVIVHKDWRRRGLAADVENHICEDLAREGMSKVGFVSYDNGPSLALHAKLGAVVCAIYSKFIRRVNP